MPRLYDELDHASARAPSASNRLRLLAYDGLLVQQGRPEAPWADSSADVSGLNRLRRRCGRRSRTDSSSPPIDDQGWAMRRRAWRRQGTGAWGLPSSHRWAGASVLVVLESIHGLRSGVRPRKWLGSGVLPPMCVSSSQGRSASCRGRWRVDPTTGRAMLHRDDGLRGRMADRLPSATSGMRSCGRGLGADAWWRPTMRAGPSPLRQFFWVCPPLLVDDEVHPGVGGARLAAMVCQASAMTFESIWLWVLVLAVALAVSWWHFFRRHRARVAEWRQPTGPSCVMPNCSGWSRSSGRRVLLAHRGQGGQGVSAAERVWSCWSS